MDTLKSLSDVRDTKLLLIGAYDVAELMTSYDQVARRGENIHYRRYHIGNREDEKEFCLILKKFLSLWPCKEVPPLAERWREIMSVSLGSPGLLKMFCLRLLCLQISSKGERFDPKMLIKAAKAKKLLETIERMTMAGEEVLRGACYGESIFADTKLPSTAAPAA